jgi:hypothetical protein
MQRSEFATVKEAEEIRRELGLSEEAFSIRLGFSSRAYYQAKQRGKLSWWMSREISIRYGRILSEVRQ